VIDNGSSYFSVAIVVPVYRDWESCSILCRLIDEACGNIPEARVRLLLVDDGSPERDELWDRFAPQNLQSIEVLRLRRNVGHQRAIAIGLCHVYQNVKCHAVMVMDGDGEDRPTDSVRLIQQAIQQPKLIVFAERCKRLESRTFRMGYVLYRLLHLTLTGVSVRVGNFSIVPFSTLSCLVCMPELWNHYAGAVFKSKLPFQTIPMDRGKRYRGQSHMNLVALVNHGMSGIATFHDAVATRILIAQVSCCWPFWA
jgi:glycosyltransferase involved in cell wall biosynthesis